MTREESAGEIMNVAGEPTSSDEYFVTAHQIFDCCGVDITSTLRVDSLMDKFTPFVKTNKAEFSYLKTVLDPEQCNPEINVTKLANALHQYSQIQKNKMNVDERAEFSYLETVLDPEPCNPEINVTKLANALHQYSENHKTKLDLDESFNLRCGQAPQDSDSGISTDGMQLLEDLQCELKEKDRLAHQLRKQLDFLDRQHEETTAALTAERDSLRRHLNILREENASLSHVRRDYDDACERICSSGAALDNAKRELEGLKRSVRVTRDQLTALEADKLSLQELLSKSKDECHRINEMYATRQSALLEENETLKSQHAELSSRMQDQDEFLQQVIKEKVLLEMELKDMLNKSNQNLMRLDRSIDISYTEDQMLTALDSLNADSRFSSENRILDDDSFLNALKDEQGRTTNMSLFDEIRMSFNMSRLNVTEFTAHCDRCSLDNSIITTATQTEETEHCNNCNKGENSSIVLKNSVVATATQTAVEVKPYLDIDKDDNSFIKSTQTENDGLCVHCPKDGNLKRAGAQMTKIELYHDINKIYVKPLVEDFETQTDFEINAMKEVVIIQKNDLGIQTDTTNEIKLYSDGDKAQHCVNVNRKLRFDTSLPEDSENNAQYKDYVNVTFKVDIEIQTECSMQNELCISENNVQFIDAKDYNNIATQTDVFIRKRPKLTKQAQKLFKLVKFETEATQTDEIEPYNNNNNAHSVKCLECDDKNMNTNTLKRNLQYSNMIVKDLETKINEYENNLAYLEELIGQGKDKNERQQALVDNLRSKIEILESAYETHRNVIVKITSTETCCVQSQTEFDLISVSTQADAPCLECDKRKTITSHRGLRRFFWEPLKCLFQMFAVVCFLGAISLLYGVSQRGRVRCDRDRGATPWRWFDAQDLMDLLLRIEYTAEVPM